MASVEMIVLKNLIIFGFHSSVAEDSSLVECDAA